MNTFMSRRLMIAGAASLPVAAMIPAAALAAEPDPIFAAIEKHRAATKVVVDTKDEEDLVDACHVQDDAAEEMVSVEPTTLAGVMTLLRYVTEHDVAFSHQDWPADLSDGETLNARGRPLEMPFHGWLIRQVLSALEGMQVQPMVTEA